MNTLTQQDTVVVPDWAQGYVLDVPCFYADVGCRHEVEWLGRQHSCISAHFCDMHHHEVLETVNAYFVRNGKYVCNRRCGGHFPTLESFLRFVRI